MCRADRVSPEQSVLSNPINSTDAKVLTVTYCNITGLELGRFGGQRPLTPIRIKLTKVCFHHMFADIQAVSAASNNIFRQ